MPGTNLTRDEAATRGQLLDITAYAIDLDLTTGDTTFGSTTTITFTATTPGTSTFADLVDAEIHEITLNGRVLDAAAVYLDGRIQLDDLAAENTLVVKADCRYTNIGQGLHRFVDPVDNRVYTYSQFEVPDARRVYTSFEQPDLKSVFTFTVKAPDNWKVVSNSPTPAPVAADAGTAVWSFAPTERMSTYITAIIAGEYHEVQDVYEGKYGTIPMGHYCRQSVKEYLDRENVVETTKQSFAFFEEQFDFPYPFGKYDQLYVPEYNMGAMENAGAVTLRDEYLPRSRQPRSFYEFRTSVITHEMAHMWFGNLVTMQWWDDLWLNESFAEWACYWCEAEATEFTDAWTGFANARKQTGYRADQLPSTHPIAADNVDLEAVEVNFDMITYAKGASVLKQLVAWVGLEPFLAGLRQYFKDHAFGNATFADLLAALEKSSGRELKDWAAEWLQTAGVNTLAPAFTVDEAGNYASFSVQQSAAADHPTLRRHRLGLGLYNFTETGALERTEYLEVDVQGAETELAAMVGKAQPDLLLLNDQDHAYAKIRLDERSLATAIGGLSKLTDSLARALVWGAAWDMTRDGEMPAREYVDLVLANIGSETDSWGVTRIPAMASTAVNYYSDPAARTGIKDVWATGLRALLARAEAGSDHQLTFARQWAGAATSDEALAEVAGLLEGSVVIEGLAIDQEMRWGLLTALASKGKVGESEVAAELERDNTVSGLEAAAGVRAAQPTVEAKATAWAAVLDPETPNERARETVLSIFRFGQEEVTAGYVEKYLEAAEHVMDTLGFHKGSTVVEYGFPKQLGTAAVLAQLDAWLEASPAPKTAKRYVLEARADLARALTAQARDAQA